jgi:hypothetical protein
VLVSAGLVAGGIVVVGALQTTAQHAVVARALPDGVTVSTETPRPDPERAAGPPRGLAAGSLLRPAAFARVLRRAGAAGPGRLKLLRLAPERADLQLARRGGGLDLVQLRWDAAAATIVHAPGGGAGGTPGLRLAALDAHAPQRLVRAAMHRLGRAATAVDYLVLLDAGGGPRWSAHLHSGAAFLADAHGRITRRIQ